MVNGIVQTALRAIYPPECLTCRAPVETEFGLCGACWGETSFLGNAVCDQCGVPQLAGMPEERLLCDVCHAAPKPWHRGRAALGYHGNARRLVLGLKYGDRQDIVGPAAQWMARAAAPLIVPDMIVAPVPLHWTRLIQRRYNQSALLAKALGDNLGMPVCLDLLQRLRRTRKLDGMTLAERHGTVLGALRVNPRRRTRIVGGRPVLLVDDVLTTGATLGACTQALIAANAGQVSVIALARATREH